MRDSVHYKYLAVTVHGMWAEWVEDTRLGREVLRILNNSDKLKRWSLETGEA